MGAVAGAGTARTAGTCRGLRQWRWAMPEYQKERRPGRFFVCSPVSVPPTRADFELGRDADEMRAPLCLYCAQFAANGTPSKPPLHRFASATSARAHQWQARIKVTAAELLSRRFPQRLPGSGINMHQGPGPRVVSVGRKQSLQGAHRRWSYLPHHTAHHSASGCRGPPPA
jgi:hypothetical protein